MDLALLPHIKKHTSRKQERHIDIDQYLLRLITALGMFLFDLKAIGKEYLSKYSCYGIIYLFDG